MIRDEPFRLVWALLAVVIYGVLVGAVIYYWKYETKDHTKHYVPKTEEQTIAVGVVSPPPSLPTKAQHTTPNRTPKSTTGKHLSPKKASQNSDHKKSSHKKRDHKKHDTKKDVVKSPTKLHTKSHTQPNKREKTPKIPSKQTKSTITERKKRPTHKSKTTGVKDIFAKVPTRDPIKKSPLSTSDLFSHLTLPEKKVPTARTPIHHTMHRPVSKRERGIENGYLAKVEAKLNGWPAQSEYAGKRAKVRLKIEPDGSFVFTVIAASEDQRFNDGLVAYLKQLQYFGFEPHSGRRAYEVEVEFVAKE